MRYFLPLVASAAVAFGAASAIAQPKPADAGQFVGKWQVAFPDGESVIVNKPTISCDDPIVVTQIDDHMIRVVTPAGGDTKWAIKEFGDGLPWWQDDDVQVTVVARWVEWDAFLLADKDASGTKSDWKNAKQWTKCE